MEWSSFYDSFLSAVHKSSLSDIEKFNYLKGFLRDEALKTVSGLTLTSENYVKALDLLKEWYGNKEIIIAKLMKELVNLPSIKSDEDLKGLRRVYDKLENHVKSFF